MFIFVKEKYENIHVGQPFRATHCSFLQCLLVTGSVLDTTVGQLIAKNTDNTDNRNIHFSDQILIVRV